MAVLRKHTNFVRVVAVFLAGTFLSACMTWHTQSLQPERFQSADSTQTLRLTLTSGDTVIVHAPVIAHDSLVGLQTRPDSLDRRVSIPLTAISQAETEKSDDAATGMIALIASLALVAAMCQGFLCSGTH